MIIYLIGYRCCGKTSVGRGLAARLGFGFLDMDREIVRMEGTSIREMVEANGWEYFRGKETDLLERISHGKACVVATGGGIVTQKGNIEVLNRSGRVIWLKASPETVERRIWKDDTTGDYRPALTDKGVAAEIRETMTSREPLYSEAADQVIDTDAFSIPEVIEAIVDLVDVSGNGTNIEKTNTKKDK